MKMGKQRVIVFDLLRILAIGMIVSGHVLSTLKLQNMLNIGNLFFFPMAGFGVVIFLCVSGAVLELNKTRTDSLSSYLKFEFHRLSRIYPAYWVSLLFGIMLFLYAKKSNFGNLFWQFSGFNAFTGKWGGPINGVGWCIGLFVVLYLMYPFISQAVNKKPYWTLTGLAIISVASIMYLKMYGTGVSPERWFPLCNLFYFGLGVFLVNRSWYPKISEKNGIVSLLGELSFYIFLFHYPILGIAKTNIPIFLGYVLGLSIVAMLVDKRIQVFLKEKTGKYCESFLSKMV